MSSKVPAKRSREEEEDVENKPPLKKKAKRSGNKTAAGSKPEAAKSKKASSKKGSAKATLKKKEVAEEKRVKKPAAKGQRKKSKSKKAAPSDRKKKTKAKPEEEAEADAEVSSSSSDDEESGRASKRSGRAPRSRQLDDDKEAMSNAEREQRLFSGVVPSGMLATPEIVEATKKRAVHNRLVWSEKEAAAERRLHFFAKNMNSFEDFVPKPVREALLRQAHEAKAQRKAEGRKLPPVSEPLTEQPACLVGGKMHPYQLEGLNWMISLHDRGVGGILADEMGLGKTMQVISFLGYLKTVRNIGGPHLVIAPLSVLSSWTDELARWCPALRVVRFHGTASERSRTEQLANRFGDFDVVVTSYEMVRQSTVYFETNYVWRYVIIDEAQRAKNERASTSQVLRNIRSYGCFLLTGTPIQNNLHELWSLLNLLYPELFTSSDPFDDAYNDSAVDATRVARSQKMLQPLMLRRTKQSAQLKLPPKTETRIYVPLSQRQAFCYKQLLSGGWEEIAKASGEGTSSDAAASLRGCMSVFMELRKCCLHPALLQHAQPLSPDAGEDELIGVSGKMVVLDKLLRKLKNEGHRVLLFSQFSSMLNLLEQYCLMRGLNYARLDGTTNRVRRRLDIRRFNAPDSPLFIYLISTRAGGLGINLATADTVIHFDSDFNPMQDLQAQDRAHRLGQTKPVHVYRLISEGTVEERIAQRADRKLLLDALMSVNQLLGGQLDVEKLSRDELLSMLMYGADRLFRTSGEAEDIKEQDIDAIIRRSEEIASKAASALTAEGKTAAGAASTSSGSGGDGDTAMSPVHSTADPLAGASAESKSAPDSMCEDEDAELPPETDAPMTQLEVVSVLEAGKKAALDFDFGAMTRAINQFQNEVIERKPSAPEADWVPLLPRERQRRTVEVHVPGVGKVMTTKEQSDEGEGGKVTNEAKGKSSKKGEPGNGKQEKSSEDAGEQGKFDWQDECQLCKEEGELVCCDWCPRVYHPECLDMDGPPKGWLSCPQHSCAVCKRNTSDAGGLLFRCLVCPCAYCEDHLTPDRVEVGRCKELEALGYHASDKAFYIICSHSCFKYYSSNPHDVEEDLPLRNASNTLLAELSEAQVAPEHVCPCQLQNHEDETKQASEEKTYCICRKPPDLRAKWMACSGCDEWYHPRCMGLLDDDQERIEVWVCPTCEAGGHIEQANTTSKLKLNWSVARVGRFLEELDLWHLKGTFQQHKVDGNALLNLNEATLLLLGVTKPKDASKLLQAVEALASVI